MKKFLISASLVLGISGSVYSETQEVQIVGGIGGDMSCVSRNCNTSRDQIAATVNRDGNYTWLQEEPEVKGVLGHKTINGVTYVSCSGGCTLNRGFFGGTTACDSEGFCIEFAGKVREVDHKIEISN